MGQVLEGCAGCFQSKASDALLDAKPVRHDSKLFRRVSAQKVQMTPEDEARVAFVDALFDTIDKNGDKKVSKREVKAVVKAKGPDFAAQIGIKRIKDVDAWIKNADIDGDGMVDRFEFFTHMEKVAP